MLGRSVGRSRIAMVATVLALAGAGLFASVAQANDVTITISHFQFAPSPLRIHQGDYVTWVNKDPVDAQVVPSSGGFAKSPILKPGASFTARITGSGTLNYYDAFNTFMTGTLLVTRAPIPTATPRPIVVATPAPTPRPTPKPTAKPTAAPTAASSSASAAGSGTPSSATSSGVPESPGSSSGSPSPIIAAAGSVDQTGTGGFGGLGAVLLGLVLVALAFVGGMFFMSRRSTGGEPPEPLPATPIGPPPGGPPPGGPPPGARPVAPGASAGPEGSESPVAPEPTAPPVSRPWMRPRTVAATPQPDIDENAPLGSSGE